MFLINVKEEKRRLRARCKKLRESCPPEVKARLDKALTEKVLGLEEYKACETLFVFVSSPIECDTRQIIADALHYIRSFDDLSRGTFGLEEPDPQTCERVTDLSSGFCIVPGLCFDLEGYRVGFGKGYYDRFLDEFGGVTAGICYTKFTEKQLPRGAFDRHTDILVTERFINRN